MAEVILAGSSHAYICVPCDWSYQQIRDWATAILGVNASDEFWRPWGVTCSCEKRQRCVHVEVNRFTYESDAYHFHTYDSGPHHPPHFAGRPIRLTHDWDYLSEESVYKYRQRVGEIWGYPGWQEPVETPESAILIPTELEFMVDWPRA